MFIKMGKMLENTETKLSNIKCSFYNRGFCKMGNQCVFVHPLRVCSRVLEGNKCMNVRCGDRHPYKCKNFESERGCSWGSECEYVHANATTAYCSLSEIDKESYGSRIGVSSFDLELGSGGFGFDILEGSIPPTEVKTSENSEIKDNESKNKNEKDMEDLSQEVIEWAIKDVEGGNFTDKHLDAILESFEGKGNIINDDEKNKDKEGRAENKSKKKTKTVKRVGKGGRKGTKSS